MSMPEKPAPVATVLPTSDKPTDTLRPTTYFDMEQFRSSGDGCSQTNSVDRIATNEYDPTTYTKPYSPFYTHPADARRDSEQGSKRGINVEVREKDLEAGLSAQNSRFSAGKPTDDGAIKDWSGSRLGLMKKPCNEKKGMTWPKRERWDLLAGLTKGQKLAVKLLVGIVLVGAMVGITVGIDIRVNGSV